LSVMQSGKLSDLVKMVVDGKNFATVATVNPDGAPQSSVVWVTREGDTLLFSTRTERQKARNLARDPRISVSIFDLDNPYYSVEIRGRAELIEDPEGTLRKQLAQKYFGQDPPPEPDGARLIVRVVPEKITEHSA
jgi:PPOX class probable F420-dependent enzyme